MLGKNNLNPGDDPRMNIHIFLPIYQKYNYPLCKNDMICSPLCRILFPEIFDLFLEISGPVLRESSVHISEAHEIRKIFPTCDRFKSVFITGVPFRELFTILYDGVEMLMDAMFIPEGSDRVDIRDSHRPSDVTSLRDEISSLHRRNAESI